MSPWKKVYYALRYLGLHTVWVRAGLYAAKRLGTTRRTFRTRPWETIDLAALTQPGTPTEAEAYARFKSSNPPPFLFPLGQPPAVPTAMRAGASERQPPLGERLQLLAENRCVLFFHTPAPTAIDWHTNPLDGSRSRPGLVWCDLPDFLPAQGDARMLWEPSRATWALDLARAGSHGLNVPAAELFWRWLDSWMTASPPFTGFQWKCGQESSVRLIALTLAFWSLADDPCTTPARWVQFARLAWATGYRVAHHIDYAISQKNNHALSEACGLLLVSHLFPEFRDAARWNALGRRVLADELRRQTYADGSYLQHSMNYHRVMLHVSMLGLRLAELAGRPFGRDLYDRLARGGEFLFQMMDPQTGRLPQYGNNDGANALALSECDFNDYRPVIQAAHYLAHRRRLLPSGPWDEDLLWLFGAEPLREPAPAPRAPVSRAFEAGGYYTLRRGESWAMLRCHTYRDRPAHCDPLHLDLWWRGQNILLDCGTYLYYVPERPDVERYFKCVAAHNTIEIDGRDSVEYVSRFLCFPWPRARLRHFVPEGRPAMWLEGEHSTYDRKPWRVLHRRLVLALPDDLWLIVDDVLGVGEHTAALRWHLLDVPFEMETHGARVRLATPRGEVWISVSGRPCGPQAFSVVRGRDEPGGVQGFAAPYYAERRPVPTLVATFRGPLPLRIITTLNPGEAVILERDATQQEGERWRLRTATARWLLELSSPGRTAAAMLRSCTPLPAGQESPP